MPRGSLSTYKKKRDFQRTPEPAGKVKRSEGDAPLRYVVHEHHASRLHYDLRLEMAGVLKSFAVPKGPSMNPEDKRMAVQTEDHPIEYLEFTGTIGDGNYGAGEMVIWDQGFYEPVEGYDPETGIEGGKLHIVLAGKRLQGEFILVKARFGGSADGRNWLLFKKRDEYAIAGWQPE